MAFDIAPAGIGLGSVAKLVDGLGGSSKVSQDRCLERRGSTPQRGLLGLLERREHPERGSIVAGDKSTLGTDALGEPVLSERSQTGQLFVDLSQAAGANLEHRQLGRDTWLSRIPRA